MYVWASSAAMHHGMKGVPSNHPKTCPEVFRYNLLGAIVRPGEEEGNEAAMHGPRRRLIKIVRDLVERYRLG